MKSHFIRARLVLSLVLVALCIMISSKSFAAAPKPRLNVTTLKMINGSQYKLRIYNAKKNYKVYFSSSSSAVVLHKKPLKGKSVILTAKKLGLSKIKVVVKSGKKTVYTSLCKVTVLPSAATLKFVKNRISLIEGGSKKVRIIIKPNNSCEIPTYSSSNPDVATVNSLGKITAIAPGKAIIIATLSNGISCQCNVIVKPSLLRRNFPNYFVSGKRPMEQQ